MQALKQREKAQVAIHFSKIQSRDSKNRVKTVLVPGSEGKQYKVIIRRFKQSNGFVNLTTECLLITHSGFIACQGNKNVRGKKPCYHSQTAIDVALNDADFSGKWCWNYSDASRLNQIVKGQIIAVVSHQNNNQKAWLLVSRKES